MLQRLNAERPKNDKGTRRVFWLPPDQERAVRLRPVDLTGGFGIGFGVSGPSDLTKPAESRGAWRREGDSKPISQRDEKSSKDHGGAGKEATSERGDVASDATVLDEGRRSEHVETDPIEAALAHALRAATEAGRWELVGQLASELQARRVARCAPNVATLTPGKRSKR